MGEILLDNPKVPVNPKRALFISKNLIGDGLNIYPALEAWETLHGDWFAQVLTLPGSEVIYENMNLMVSVITERDPNVNYDFEFTFDCGQAFRLGDQYKIHIAKAYAMMLGVDQHIKKYELSFKARTFEEHKGGLILISPFSRSCASQQGMPPNKMLPWEKLAPIINQLRKRGEIGILGAKEDRLPSWMGIDESEYYTGLDLSVVACMLRDCKFLVTIDNGISHLAATQGTKSLVFYPACLGLHWIIPLNDNATIIQMNPATVVLPELMWQVKQVLEDFER